MIGKHTTQQEALDEPMFFVDASFLPRMLVEYTDGSYGWEQLGNYQGRSRGPMTKQEQQEALANATKHRWYDVNTNSYIYDVKRGVLIQDNRKHHHE